jgi:hypothetical protein
MIKVEPEVLWVGMFEIIIGGGYHSEVNRPFLSATDPADPTGFQNTQQLALY